MNWDEELFNDEMNISKSTNYYSKSEYNNIYNLFDSLIGSEIRLNITNADKTGLYKVISYNNIKEFLDKLFILSCPRILNYNVQMQQIYLLHLSSTLFSKLSDNLYIDKDLYIEQIYLPNILIIASKFLGEARKLINKLVKTIYLEIEDKSKEIISFYAELYNADSNIIKTDIVYIFLREVLPQFDPLEIVDLEEFFSNIFRKLFFFYLKQRTSSFLNGKDLDYRIIQDVNPPSERYRIYTEALALTQMQITCQSSTAAFRISKQYDRMKEQIIPNELQKLYFLAVKKEQLTNDNKTLLFNIDSELDKNIEQKFPLIYKLLRSIHISSEVKFLCDNEIELLRSSIYTVIENKFKHILNDDILKPILHKITGNLVLSLTNGEYLDMVTLQPVSISSPNFIKQLQTFLESILGNAMGNNVMGNVS